MFCAVNPQWQHINGLPFNNKVWWSTITNQIFRKFQRWLFFFSQNVFFRQRKSKHSIYFFKMQIVLLFKSTFCSQWEKYSVVKNWPLPPLNSTILLSNLTASSLAESKQKQNSINILFFMFKLFLLYLFILYYPIYILYSEEDIWCQEIQQFIWSCRWSILLLWYFVIILDLSFCKQLVINSLF